MVNRFQQLSLWQYPLSEALATFGQENHTAYEKLGSPGLQSSPLVSDSDHFFVY
jgi:hypothetical protein